MEDNPGPSTAQDDSQLSLAEGEDDDLPEMLPENISPTICEMATQTVWLSVTMVDASTQCEVPTTCDALCQFPRDVCETTIVDHTYCDRTARQTVHGQDTPEEVEEIHVYDDNNSQGSQLDLFPELNDDEPNEEETVVDEDAGDELIEVIISQETVSSQSEYDPSQYDSTFQDEGSGSEEQRVELESSVGKQRVFLVYEQKLKELLRFCPSCGSPTVQESIDYITSTK